MDTGSIIALVVLFLLLMPIAAGKKKMLPFILGLLITVFFFSYFITQTYKNTAMQIGTIISTFVILIIFGNNHLEESWLLTITYLTLLYGSFYQFGLFSI
tara:strand:+ start:216 stop:515 length:300 start_codon:yes stop_codon:yes gene_type:complete